MVRVHAAAIVRRPPAEVFSYMTSIENEVVWMGPAGLEESGIRPPGPIQVTTRRVEVRRLLGRRVETTFEVIAHEPGRRLSMVTVTGPFPMAVTYDVAPLDESRAAEVVLMLETHASGPFALLLPLIARAARRRFARDLATLQRLLDPYSTAPSGR
jgi:hypothetical protein